MSSPLIPATAGIQNNGEELGPRFRGDERLSCVYAAERAGSRVSRPTRNAN